MILNQPAIPTSGSVARRWHWFKQLTHTSADDSSPCWSPDGRWFGMPKFMGVAGWRKYRQKVASRKPLIPAALPANGTGLVAGWRRGLPSARNRANICQHLRNAYRTEACGFRDHRHELEFTHARYKPGHPYQYSGIVRT